jgi:hypothetical protein
LAEDQLELARPPTVDRLINCPTRCADPSNSVHACQRLAAPRHVRKLRRWRRIRRAVRRGGREIASWSEPFVPPEWRVQWVNWREIMPDKSPHEHHVKKPATKTLKEKRAEKHAKAAGKGDKDEPFMPKKK